MLIHFLHQTHFHLQLLHWVLCVGGVRLGVARRVPQVQRSPPQTHLHVPGAPAVLPVLVGSGRVELRIPQVSEEEERSELKEQIRPIH